MSRKFTYLYLKEQLVNISNSDYEIIPSTDLYCGWSAFIALGNDFPIENIMSVIDIVLNFVVVEFKCIFKMKRS